MPPRAVVDNNAAVSFMLTNGATLRDLFERWHAKQFEYVTSRAILDELRIVVAQPRFDGRWQVDPSTLVRSVEEDALRTEGALIVEGVCRDPKDDKLLACAVEGLADYLVTGDRDLLVLREFRGVRIVAPVEFVRILAEAEASG